MSDQQSGPENPYGQPASSPPPSGQPPSSQPGPPPPPPPAYGSTPPSYGSPPAYGSSTGSSGNPYGSAPSDPAYGYGGGYAGGYADPATAKRPGTVTAAAVITWISCGLVGLLLGIGMAAIAGGSDAIVNEIEQQPGFEDINVSAEDLIGVAQGVLGFFLFCSLLGILFAVIAFRRSNVGRILLVIWAGLTALFSLLAITSGVSFVTLLASVAVIVLLFTGGANQWYASKSLR